MLKLYGVLNIGCEQLPHIGLGLMISVAETLKAGNNEPILMHFLGEILNKVENAAKETVNLLTFCLILFCFTDKNKISKSKGQTIEK